MKITTGKLEVFESGIVRTGVANSVKFDFDVIWAEFVFLEDDQKTYRSEYNISEDGNGLFVKLYNSAHFGNGIVNPLKIGSLNGREFFVSYRCFRPFQEETWVLEYTFYKGDEVNE